MIVHEEVLHILLVDKGYLFFHCHCNWNKQNIISLLQLQRAGDHNEQ